ncbi:kinase-like domain-containing protein [Podospora australis]|uniref:cAMP-dependent protein kinase n=1 Tax=Podospora australis TaxID=1536484 RepID=A0AAN6X477_9PEZI|nr:kinase-like domain-containing protein [Podospora australis]
MAATVAHSNPLPAGGSGAGGGGGLHPMQAKGLAAQAAAAANAARQQEKHVDDEPFDLESRKLSLSDFQRVRTLGTGTFARVCLVRPSHGTEEQRSQVYALKILRKTEVIKLKQIDHVRHERQILADVAGHPFITKFMGSFSDHDFLYILLDYIPGGELFTYLRKYRHFDEDMARFYAAEIVLVLEYLHEHQGGIAYRDMKPENLLLDAEGHIKLVDFGFAKRLGNNENAHPEETYTLCGTPEYLAPEVIHNKGHTTAVDWWALGILIYEFLTGYPPFWHSNPIEIYKQIVEYPVTFPENPPISEEAKDIIRQFCTVDRSRRLGNISGGAARVKAHPFFAGVDWDAILNRTHSGPIIPPIRYYGDAQCFDIYPEEDVSREEYTDEMAQRYDDYFKDF